MKAVYVVGVWGCGREHQFSLAENKDYRHCHQSRYSSCLFHTRKDWHRPFRHFWVCGSLDYNMKKSKSSGSYNINMEKKTLLFLIIITNRTTLECEYLDHCVSHLDMHLQILLTLTNRYCWSVPRQDPDTDKPSVYCVITIPAITLCHHYTCCHHSVSSLYL